MSSPKERNQGNLSSGIKSESLDSPESIIGSPFKIPSIVGRGSGRGFTFDGLHLPIGWEKAIPDLKQIDWEGFYSFFVAECEREDLKPGKISVDRKTGIMTGITIKNRPEASIKMANDFDMKDGIYKAENVNDIHTAIRFQRTSVAFLSRVNQLIGLKDNYSYIDGRPGQYYSMNLFIPKDILKGILKMEGSVTNDYYRERFKMRASNIAGRFGLTANDIHFNSQGIPDSFGIEEGNGCNYYLDPDGRDGTYHGHNIDTPYQAAVLHGIASSFINDMIRRSRQNSGV